MPTPKITVQDVDAYSDISNGSTISLASGGSEGNGYSPRPPPGGSTRSQSVQGRRSRVGTPSMSKSPYASKKPRGTPIKTQPVKPSSRNLWLTAMRNGTGSLSTENTGINTWTGPRPAHAKKRRGPGTRTRNFSDVVELSNAKPKTHTRSATLSYTEPTVTGGGPAYKPPEDYYDEVIELKKIINFLKEENNVLNTKLHRVEQENVLKDRKMGDLLNPRKQPEDMRRTLTDKKGDTSSIVNSLKQKLHGVERTVKEKEAEISKLKRDRKMTDVEELRIQTETYYQEVQRLQLALIEMQQSQVHQPGAMTDFYGNGMRSTKGKHAATASGQRLQDENDFLKAENKSLKKDMITVIESQANNDTKKPLNVEYADMSRGQLLQTIHELETKVDEVGNKSRTRSKEMEDDSGEDEGRSSKRLSKDIEGRLELRGSTSQKLSQLKEREAELLEEREKQRNVIERLKEDRTHYRNVADELRQQLNTAEDELEKLRSAEASTPARSASIPAASERRKPSITSTASQYSPRKSSIRAKEREEQMETELEEFQQRHAAKTLQKQWRQYKGKKDVERERGTNEQERAAATLQKQWRRHRDFQRTKEEVSQEEALTDIQAALRGHMARRQRLDNLGEKPDEQDSDDAIINIQSAMRGHMARTKGREEAEYKWSRDGTRDMSRRSGKVLSDSEESDDDIVNGGTPAYRRLSPPASKDKSPFSSHKRSSFTATSPESESLPPQAAPRTRTHTSSHPPRPAPRTPKTPDSTPPLPSPRHVTKPTVPTISLPDSNSDSDEGVVVGSKAATRTGKDLAPSSPMNAHKTLNTKRSAKRSQPKGSSLSVAPQRKVNDTGQPTSGVLKVDDSGLTKRVNPQRTIKEASEDSDDDAIVTSSSRKQTRAPERRPSNSRKEQNKQKEKSDKSRYVIIDSDDDDDDEDDVIVTSSKGKSAKASFTSSQRPGLSRQSADRSSSATERPALTKSTGFSGSQRPGSTRRSSKEREPARPFGKTGRVVDEESEEDSEDDDVIVTSKRAIADGKKNKSVTSTRSSLSKTSTSKKNSVVNSSFTTTTKSRSTESNSTRRRSLFDDSDDDSDDDDIVISSSTKSKAKTTSKSSTNKRDSKSSLSSLWSSSTREKKESTSGLDFSTFGTGLTSSSRRNDSKLDELF